MVEISESLCFATRYLKELNNGRESVIDGMN
jgi:hypothetical protein